MAEGLVLTDPSNVDRHRAALVEDIPTILEAAGAGRQADWYRQGHHDQVVDWVKQEVSVGIHGYQPGKFGVTIDREPDLNVVAQQHNLIGPVRLWQPGDPIPEGQRPGHIAEYKVVGDPESLSLEVLRAKVFLVQGATHDGMIGRIDSALQAAAHAEREPGEAPPEVVMLTGMRRTEEREGLTGLYRETLQPDKDPTKPITEVHLSEADSALAILQSRCKSFTLVDERGDPDKDHKPVDRIHPELGGRTWITRRYAAELSDDRGGRQIFVTVVNGEPLQTPARLNAGRAPAPLAVEILKDWLHTIERDDQLDVALSVTYAHLARIGSELLAHSGTVGQPLGRISLLGSMPQEAVWTRTAVDPATQHVVHNGASLVLGEVIPQIKAFNALLGRSPFDIGR